MKVGFSYSIPVNGYVDPSSEAIITLPDAICPDYAQQIGTCGTYSYANLSLTANSTRDAAPNFWKTLQGFMGVFPQYSRSGFHFTSESYGGHYGPIFNECRKLQSGIECFLPEVELSFVPVVILTCCPCRYRDAKCEEYLRRSQDISRDSNDWVQSSLFALLNSI